MFLELLTETYRKTCSEGEAEIYRAHVAVLGNSEAFKANFIKWLCNEPGIWRVYAERRGIKTRQINSKFNRVTQKTEGWKESESISSELMQDVMNAVLSHIRSVQPSDPAERERESLQLSHFPSADSVGKKSSTTNSESNKSEKEGLRENIVYKPQTTEKEYAVQFQNPDKETLFLLHRNVEIKKTPDNNIPYSINLWEFDSQDEFSAVSHLFLKAEALILYVMDLSLDSLSPMEQLWDDKNTNKNPKTPAKILSYWLNLVHIKAKKRNLKPNIVLLLIHPGWIQAAKQNTREKILNMVEGKPYAPYISKENIILVDNCQDSFKDIRCKLFDRITMLPSWGVKRPIRWLCLKAELLKRNSYPLKYEIDDYDFVTCCAERVGYLLVSEVKEIASTYGMDDCEVDFFLEFNHALGDFICSPPSKLGRFVIMYPQWLLDKFSKLLAQVSRTHRRAEMLHYEHRYNELLHYEHRYNEPLHYRHRYDESLHCIKAIFSLADLHLLWG